MLFRFSLLIILSIFALNSLSAEELYHKAYGNSDNPAIIFLHGGPGYNSSTFEFTTAQNLADEGYLVICYDRRGEGRSEGPALYTFKQSIDDILYLYNFYSLDRASIIGHSFGVMLGTKFMEAYPEKCDALILVGAPVNLQESFLTIISNARNFYETKEDKNSLAYLTQLESMDKSSLQYAVYSFMHAMQTGAYSTEEVSQEALSIKEKVQDNEEFLKYSQSMTQPPTMGFWGNERYTTIDLSELIGKLANEGNRIFGIYGDEDGLYSPSQLKNLGAIIGSDNLRIVDGASHSVFIDQQSKFLAAVNNFIADID